MALDYFACTMRINQVAIRAITVLIALYKSNNHIGGNVKRPVKNNMITYSPAQLRHIFTDTVWTQGERYYQQGRVISCDIESYVENQQLIFGEVEGNAKVPYDLCISLIMDKRHKSIGFSIDCDCGAYRQCKHAAALLLAACLGVQKSPDRKNIYESMLSQADQSADQMLTSDQLSDWIAHTESVQAAQPIAQPVSDHAILYVLKQSRLDVSLKPMTTRLLKKGGYGKISTFSENNNQTRRALTPEDKRLLAWFRSLSNHYSYHGEAVVSFQDVSDVLTDLLKTKRVFWQKISDQPLQLGEQQQLTWRWVVNASGGQQLTCALKDAPEHPIQLLPLAPIWYIDHANNSCGPIQDSTPPHAIFNLLTLPPLEPNAVKVAQNKLCKVFKDLPTPMAIKKVASKPLKPTASLTLFGKTVVQSTSHRESNSIVLALADLTFHYGQRDVRLNEGDQSISSYQDGKLMKIERDKKWEKSCVDQLTKAKFDPMLLQHNYYTDDDLRFSFFIGEEAIDNQVLLDRITVLNELAKKNNWPVTVEESCPVQLIDEVDDWYSDLEEGGSGIDWFSLTLGVIVNGEKINILPLLVEVIRTRFRQLDSQAIVDLPDNTACPLRLESGQYISVPFSRIRHILLILCELFDERALDEKGALNLSRLQSGLLVEIQRALGATKLRWFGGEKLRKFGEKLANFDGIQRVKPPKRFTATLRPYQKQGLNWLQFLREYELGGILADDMGLGKTIQTLAHLSVEKTARRLKKPTLLVAPTSLVNNWMAEAQRFAPNLSMLLLHGKDRKARFTEIERADVIITTYPLIIRDKATLLEHHYYYLILDEAQQIKNAKAKATQILLQMQAVHRLCLTGTPMENHLGELWSIFNFILPGLLGPEKQFTTVFRNPIERNGDGTRHKQLISRIKPFMLRRRKDDVLKDLPTKTEMVRSIELGSEQQDLYESVRLSMEKHVRNAISDKGLNRSQIVILDALLKLRQICCAPSLLKLKTVKKTIESAKLEDLMSFLPNLMEEGRRVLLFSSFTSMLTLIETELKEKSIPYVKLTGQTRDRKTPVEQFQSGKVPLFLISLKAGGLGLNLTTADTVIHYDPWWNPAAEQQATDRAHRIGQKNPVFVYKLITKGTVEEKILEMQAKKRQLISGVVEQEMQKSVKLTQNDLNVLFQPMDS